MLFAISGVKNSGKTTLIAKLIPILTEKGLKVATIKHDGHEFAPDVPGTDTWAHLQAGALGTAIFSDTKFMVVKQEAGVTETRLQEMFPEADLILLEGFKYSSYPKMEILRQGNSETGICPKENLVAWVSDFLQDPELEAEQGIPLLDLNDPEQIAEYIIAFWYARTQMSMILLAGGLSSRMGSDKADLCWNGKTFLEHQIEKGKRLGITDIVVSGYRGIRCDLPVAPDRYEQKGPLGGMESCMRQVKNRRCLVLSVDVPLIPVKELVGLVLETMTYGRNVVLHQEKQQSRALILQHGERQEPLIGVYDTNMADEMEREILQGKGSVFTFLRTVGYGVYKSHRADACFSNINDKARYQQLQGEKQIMENVEIEQAQKLILERTKILQETELVGILDAGGRILAQDMTAEIDNPPFNRSPIDGYACRSEDVKQASREHPVYLQVLEEIDAGHYSEVKVGKGQAVRIMTGAAIPEGCDCCIMQEHTDYGDEKAAVYEGVSAWTNFCYRGEDFKKGTLMIKKDTKLGYVETGILASMGCAEAVVYRHPKVSVLTTGDEVTSPGQPLQPGKIYNSNLTMLVVRLRELGIRPVLAKTISDDPELMGKALKDAAAQSDLIITTGGVSVGKKDILHKAVQVSGSERVFWRVIAKPGTPVLFSVCEGVPVISLSGNPFGAAANFEMLIRPALAKMTRDESLNPVVSQAVMADPFFKESKRRRFIRGILKDGQVYMPSGLHSSGVLSSLQGCNCIVDIPAGSGALKPGDPVKVVLIF